MREPLIEFSADEVRAALAGKEFELIVDGVRRALNMALPICEHARLTGKRNRKAAALLELQWRPMTIGKCECV